MQVARIYDITFGMDYSKNPPIASAGLILGPGNTRVLVNGKPIATSCDLVRAFTGGMGVIFPRPRNILSNGKPISCVIDMFYGSYVGNIITGSHNVMTKI